MEKESRCNHKVTVPGYLVIHSPFCNESSDSKRETLQKPLIVRVEHTEPLETQNIKPPVFAGT